MCRGMAVRNRIVDGGENASDIEEGVSASGVVVSSDDLADIVDAECNSAITWPTRGQGIVEGGVAATIVEEAVGTGGVVVLSDDLARFVDAARDRAVGG